MGNNRNAQAFVESKALDLIYDYQFSKEIIEEFKGYGITLPKSTRLRFVRVELETGEIEVLLTSLVDQVK